jgi:hypothetical protein
MQSNSGRDAMTAQDAARQFRALALRNGMLQRERAAPEPPAIERQFDPARLRAATDVLQHRHINFIGFNEDRNEVVVYTSTTLTKADMPLVPTMISGTPVRYIKGGAAHVGAPPPPPMGVSPYSEHNGRYTCGSSIYVGNMIGAGTLGCLVEDGHGILCGLTNNHVSAACNYAPLAMPIVAPGPIDVTAGSLDPFTIGHHYGLFPFVDGLDQNVAVNDNLDAAIFRIKDPGGVSSMQRNAYDTPAMTMPVAAGMTVQKVGRTTGITQGYVRAQSVGPEPVEYLLDEIDIRKTVYFDPLFIVESQPNAFADIGDSGSLITHLEPNGNRLAVGIVVAVSKDRKLTYAADIGRILNYFGATLRSGHNA